MPDNEQPPCFENTLPTPAEKKRAERAIRKGLTGAKGIRHFSLIADQSGEAWTLRITFTDSHHVQTDIGPDRQSEDAMEHAALELLPWGGDLNTRSIDDSIAAVTYPRDQPSSAESATVDAALRAAYPGEQLGKVDVWLDRAAPADDWRVSATLATGLVGTGTPNPQVQDVSIAVRDILAKAGIRVS